MLTYPDGDQIGQIPAYPTAADQLPDTIGGDQIGQTLDQTQQQQIQQQTPSQPTQTPSQIPDPTTSDTFFNLPMIYPLKPGGNYWVMPASGHDARGPDEGGGKLTRLGDEFRWSDNREVRNEVSSVAKRFIPKAFIQCIAGEAHVQQF